jgi:regulatory protein
MKIEKFKKLRDNRYKVILNNKTEVVLYDDIILKYNILLTKEISELDKILKENTKLECYYKAIKYLSNKSRCKKEVINYLKRFNYDMEDINNTIKTLEEKNYLNEESYITAFINDQVNLSSNGPEKIKNKLVNLGFSLDQITPVLDNIDNNIWLEKLEKIITKKVKSNNKDSERKLKERILYSCLNDGFSKSDITSILNNIEIPKNKELILKETEKTYKKLIKKYQDSELYYQLKGKLLSKGFDSQDIEEAIISIKKAS